MTVRVNRRSALTGAAAAAAGSAVARGTAPSAAAAARRPRSPHIGAGGTPMDLPSLARIARAVSAGQPCCLVDLAAVDANTKVVLDWAAQQGKAVRPALKVSGSAQLCAYLVQRMPQPRAMVFSLRSVVDLLPRLPRGVDLLMGYPPTPDELAWWLGRRPPKRERPHRLRILVDSLAIAEVLEGLSRTSRRPLPLEVALDLDVGMGRGGMDNPDELAAVIAVLRRARERLRLTAVLGYDGHATLTGDANYRRLVADTAQDRYATFLAQLRAQASDLYDERALVRNGPASSNYRNWTRADAANEISPGSAFLYASYLDGFDHDGLHPAVTLAAPVFRITSDSPSVPFAQTTLPGSTREEILVRTLWWSDSGAAAVHPSGLETDELSGGGWAMTAPKGALALGDPVLFRPAQTGEAMNPFGAVHAVREGTLRRTWTTLPRPQSPLV